MRTGGRPRRQGAKEAVAISLVEDAVSALQAQAVVSPFDVTFDAYEGRLSEKTLQFSENEKKITWRTFTLRNRFPHSEQGNCSPDSVSLTTPSSGLGSLIGRGLCHLRCEAKLAGQLNTLSHSGQRYST